MTGSIGSIDHFANSSRHLAVEMFGRNYRVVWQRVVNGAIVDQEAADDRTFDSVYDARAHRAALAKAGAA